MWSVLTKPCDWCTDLYCEVGSGLTKPCDWCTDQHCEVGSGLTSIVKGGGGGVGVGETSSEHQTASVPLQAGGILPILVFLTVTPMTLKPDLYCEVGSVPTQLCGWYALTRIVKWAVYWHSHVTDAVTSIVKWAVYWHSHVTDAVTCIVKWAVYWHSHVTDAQTSTVKWAVYWQPCDWCTDQYCEVGSVLTAMWLMHWPVLWSGQCTDSHVTNALTSIVEWTVYWQPCDWCPDQYCGVDSVLTAMWLMPWPVLWSGQCTDSHVTDALTGIVKWTVSC